MKTAEAQENAEFTQRITAFHFVICLSPHKQGCSAVSLVLPSTQQASAVRFSNLGFVDCSEHTHQAKASPSLNHFPSAVVR